MNMNERRIPSKIKKLLDKIADESVRMFGENFVGLYVHGSIAMGCFNPQVSDVDFLIVLRRKMTLEEKRRLAQVLLSLKYDVPKGIEMSVVLLEHSRNPVYPTPYEFHFGKQWAEKHRRGEIDYTQENADADLPAHFTMVKKRGIVWRGLPIDDAFSDVRKDMYIRSLLFDLDDLDKNMVSNPVYGILNACRTIAYLKDRLVCSKKEGGEWALKNFDEKYFPIVRQALKSYETGEKSLDLDRESSSSFTWYVKKVVKHFAW